MNVNVEETATLRPTVVNVAKFGYNRSVVDRTQEAVGTKNYAAYYGLNGLDEAPAQWAPPDVSISNMAGLGDCCSPQAATQNRFQFADEVNWIHGKHNVFWGGQFFRTSFDGDWVVVNNGLFIFSGNATGQYTNGAVTAAGNPYADFLLGLPQIGEAGVGDSAAPFRSNAGSYIYTRHLEGAAFPDL